MLPYSHQTELYPSFNDHIKLVNVLSCPPRSPAHWYLHLGVLCNQQLAVISQQHAITLVAWPSETNSWPVGALSVGCGQQDSAAWTRESHVRADWRKFGIFARNYGGCLRYFYRVPLGIF